MGVVIDSGKVQAVATQGEARVRNSMVQSSIHTSVEGVARLIAARAKNDQSGTDNAFNIISNTAKVIRAVLDVQEARIAEVKEMNGLVLNIVFSDLLQVGKIPAVSALTKRLPAITNYLINTAHDMAVSAMMSDQPSEQATLISMQFTNHVKQLGPNGMNALDALTTNAATNTFDSGIGKK